MRDVQFVNTVNVKRERGLSKRMATMDKVFADLADELDDFSDFGV